MISASTRGRGQEAEDRFPDSPDPDDPEDSTLAPLMSLQCTVPVLLLFTCRGCYIRGRAVQIYVRSHEVSVVIRHGGAGGRGRRRVPLNMYYRGVGVMRTQ